MAGSKKDAALVGLLCLDIIPGFAGEGVSFKDMLIPGKLVDITDPVMATGGGANNTGLAMHRLGFDVSIVGKIGRDFFGDAVVKILGDISPGLIRDMIVSPAVGTSYSIILNPPGIDRVILHSPAANDSLVNADVPDSVLDGARLVHFGYPPLMRMSYLNDGREIKTLFERAKQMGSTTSLDMARPDPDSPAGKVDWIRFLDNVLPTVDVFVPSIDELVFMLNRKRFDDLIREAGDRNPAAFLDMEEISAMADLVLAKGAAIAGFKLGDQGFFLKASSDPSKMASVRILSPERQKEWLGVELAAACRRVNVVGTLGSGDSTIGGFLGALLKDMGPDEAATMAVAVGAASVEARDAYSGVTPWDTILERLDRGWATAECGVIPEHWAATPSGNKKRGRSGG